MYLVNVSVKMGKKPKLYILHLEKLQIEYEYFSIHFCLKNVNKKKSAVMYSEATEVAGQPRLNKSLSQQQQIVQ